MASKQIISSLLFDIQTNTADLKKGINQANSHIKGFKNDVNKVGSMMKKAFAAGAVIAATKKIIDMGKEFTRLADVQLKAEAKVKQAIESTGMAAGYTSDQLFKMASDLQNNTLFGDEEILNKSTAQLLTFTNIAGEEFARTQAIALDLATTLDSDLQSASIMLGKALNDPKANLSALSRAGIQFSESQKQMVKDMVDAGDTAKAQQLILAELERQYGGQAAAAAEAGAGAGKQLKNYLNDLKEGVGKVIIPLVNKISRWLMDNIPEAIEKTRNWIRKAKSDVIDFINQWIELYNKSTAFRVVIEGLKFYFSTVFGFANAILKTVIDNIKNTGKVLAYVFNPKNWGKGFGKGLKSLVKEGFTDVKDNIVEFGQDVKENFNTAIENSKSGQMKLITEEDEKAVIDQAKEIGKKVKQAVTGGGFIRENVEMTKVEPISAGIISNPQADGLSTTTEQLKEQNHQIHKQKTLWSELGDNISETLKTQAVDALNTMGDALTTVFEGGKASLKSFVTSMLDGIRKVINALFVEAIAGVIAGESKKGLLGIATAAIGVGILTALWKSKVPEFEGGGSMPHSGLAMVGEAGAELVSLPRGARVHSAGRTKQMMTGGNKQNIQLSGQFRVSGNDLLYVLNETERKRTNTFGV